MSSPERLLGIEVEICTNHDVKAGDLRSIPEAEHLFADVLGLDDQPAKDLAELPIVLIRNGGVIKNEVGDHLEYASPETPDPLDLVLVTRAMQWQILEALESQFEDVRVNARSIAKPTSPGAITNGRRYALFGYHENYSLPNTRDIELTRDIVSMHSLARVCFTGAGCVMYDKPRMSPKNSLFHLGKHINTGFMPRVQGIQMVGQGRLEVRNCDDTPSDFARYVGIASTALLLDALDRASQRDKANLSLRLALADSQLSAASNQTDPNIKLKAGGGQRYSLVDIEEILLNFVTNHVRLDELSDNYIAALFHWQSILEDLKKETVDPHDGRVDWLGRLAFWESTRASRPEGITGNDVCFSYDDLVIGKGMKHNLANASRLGADSDTVDPFSPPSEQAHNRVELAKETGNIYLWP